MDFSTLGSISGYARTLKLQTQWELKKNSGNANAHAGSLTELLSGVKPPDGDSGQDDKLSKIMGKVYAGKKLSDQERKYLQEKSPELYQKVRDAEREQASYEKELRKCKTKEDVQRLKLSHMGKALSTVKAVENNPHIPPEKKLEIVQIEGGKAAGIEARTRRFVKSGRYHDLPTEEEQRSEWADQAEETRDRFTPEGRDGAALTPEDKDGTALTPEDDDGTTEAFTPEKAARRRAKARRRPLPADGEPSTRTGTGKVNGGADALSPQIYGIHAQPDREAGMTAEYYA